MEVDPRSGYCSRNGVYYSKMVPGYMPPPDQAIGIAEFLFAPKRGDAVAFVDGRTGRKLTFGELEEAVRVVAAGLWQRIGIRKSDVVCILSSNSVEFQVLFLAIASLGGILTTMNPLNTEADLKKQIKLAGEWIASVLSQKVLFYTMFCYVSWLFVEILLGWITLALSSSLS